RYVFAEPKRLPRGSVLTATAHYDNSSANPNNPDPSAEVNIGPRTEDEMFNGYYDYCLTDQDLTKPAWQRWLWRYETWCVAVAPMALILLIRRWQGRVAGLRNQSSVNF